MLLILVAPNQLCGWMGREHGGSIPLADMSRPLLLRCTAVTCYTPHRPWVWGHRDETARVHHADCHMMNHEEMGMMQAVEVYKD
jgi:hypothetical protein